jgi:hypothetical protein
MVNSAIWNQLNIELWPWQIDIRYIGKSDWKWSESRSTCLSSERTQERKQCSLSNPFIFI